MNMYLPILSPLALLPVFPTVPGPLQQRCEYAMREEDSRSSRHGYRTARPCFLIVCPRPEAVSRQGATRRNVGHGESVAERRHAQPGRTGELGGWFAGFAGKRHS